MWTPVLASLAQRPNHVMGKWCGRWSWPDWRRSPGQREERKNPGLRRNTHSPGCGQPPTPLAWVAAPPWPAKEALPAKGGEFWSLHPAGLLPLGRQPWRPGHDYFQAPYLPPVNGVRDPRTHSVPRSCLEPQHHRAVLSNVSAKDSSQGTELTGVIIGGSLGPGHPVGTGHSQGPPISCPGGKPEPGYSCGSQAPSQQDWFLRG